MEQTKGKWVNNGTNQGKNELLMEQTKEKMS